MERTDMKKRMPVILSVVLVIFLLAAVFIFLQSRPNAGEQMDELLALGEKYLLAEDYENALIAFEKAIEIDEKCVDAYLGAAKAYIGLDDLDKAIKILKLGLERTQDSKIQELLLELDGKEVSVQIQQVDNSEFPNVTLYLAAKDEKGKSIRAFNKENFVVEEKVDGEVSIGEILSVENVKESEQIGVDLVLDQSGSMSENDKLEQAKYAAKKFLDGVDFANGDQVAVVSFDNQVYQKQSFTSEKSNLINTIESISPNGQTAFYDALFTALLDTHAIDGAKSIIAYTDGIENGSTHTYEEVLELANKTGIPIFIIGIGDDCDDAVLKEISTMTAGEYYGISDRELGKSLRKIYDTIYKEQGEWLKVTYRSNQKSQPLKQREVTIKAKKGYKGEAIREYIPKPEVVSVFNLSENELDYVLPNSQTVLLVESDLSYLSLSELQIARNEIFARHGRMFEDPLLNRWFNSKIWYKNTSPKYTPSEFNSLQPNPFNDVEKENVKTLSSYENKLLMGRDVFPNSGSKLLSEKDVILSRQTLERALREIYRQQNVNYGNKDALNETSRNNVELIEQAMKQ